MDEVAIVGGGPAGLSSAIALAETGISVVVIEPKKFPIDKPCGEGVMPEGVSYLKSFGIFRHIDEKQTHPVEGVCFINDNGHRAVSKFYGMSGIGCRRLALSQALYARAQEFNNIKFVSGKALRIERSKNFMRVKVEGGSIGARLVIGADGLRSLVRRSIEFERPSTCLMRYGLRKHIEIEPWSNYVEVHFSRGIEAYITPSGPRQTNFTFLWSKSELKKLDKEVSFASLLANFPGLRDRVLGHRTLSTQLAIGPLHHPCSRVVADGIALIGDASGYFDAITGEGISIALAESVVLARLVSRAIMRRKTGIIVEEQLRAYALEHRQLVRSYYRNTEMLLWLVRHPKLLNGFIRLGEANPRLFSLIIEGARNGSSNLRENFGNIVRQRLNFLVEQKYHSIKQPRVKNF